MPSRLLLHSFGLLGRLISNRAQIIRGKYDLDVVGHYARPDIFQLQVDERPKQPVTVHRAETMKEDPVTPADRQPAVRSAG